MIWLALAAIVGRINFSSKFNVQMILYKFFIYPCNLRIEPPITSFFVFFQHCHILLILLVWLIHPPVAMSCRYTMSSLTYLWTEFVSGLSKMKWIIVLTFLYHYDIKGITTVISKKKKNTPTTFFKHCVLLIMYAVTKYTKLIYVLWIWRFRESSYQFQWEYLWI